MNRKMQLLIDVSGSMSEKGSRAGISKLTDAMEGSKTFIREQYLDEDDMVGLSTFSGSLNRNVPLNRSSNGQISSMVDEIDVLRPGGGTALWDAIGESMDQLVSVGDVSSSSIIVLTDGNDNQSRRFPKGVSGCRPLMDHADRIGMDVRLFIIRVGDLVNQNCLQQLAASTGGAYLHATPEQIKEGFSSIGHRVAQGDVNWAHDRNVRIGGGGSWSRAHGVELDRNGMVTGNVETPDDIFSGKPWISHERAVKIVEGAIFIEGGDPVVGKIPRKKRMPVAIDIFNRRTDTVIQVMEEPITGEKAGEVLGSVSAIKSGYGKKVKVCVVAINDDVIPSYFKSACRALDVEIRVIGADGIITGGVIVHPGEDGEIVVEMDDEVKAISNLVPGDPGGELKDNLIVVPELKPPVRRINNIDELNVDHDLLHELEVQFDPRGDFLDLWPDARMLCQNLKRAAVHAIRANDVGKNRNVFVFWSKDRWRSGVQNFSCWMDFKRVMRYLEERYGTKMEVIFFGPGKDIE